MDLGNKILELRKKNNLSQEELAEQIGVTRQTISKWELNETAPDIKQAKELSKIFNISLDELVNNEVNSVLIEKVSNTEKLAGMIIKIIKFIGLALIAIFVIDIVAFSIFAVNRKNIVTGVVENTSINCSIENIDYSVDIGSDGHFVCSNCPNIMREEIKRMIDFSDVDESALNVREYFANKNGTCE